MHKETKTNRSTGHIEDLVVCMKIMFLVGLAIRDFKWHELVSYPKVPAMNESTKIGCQCREYVDYNTRVCEREVKRGAKG